MAGKTLAVLFLAFLAGCGSSEPAAAPVPEGPDPSAVPPAEMRVVLEGLKSDQPGTQYNALETLSRFPSVVQTYREHVQRLQEEGGDQRVRQKAAELLAPLEK